MKALLYKLEVLLENFALREKILLATLFISIVGLLWYGLLFSPLQDDSKAIKKNIISSKTIIDNFQQQITRINKIINNRDSQKLLEKHEKLNEEIKNINKKISSFKQQSISQKDLAEINHAILEKSPGTKITSFTPLNINKTNEDSEELYYRLDLTGDYISIFDYLKKLENLRWQIYWNSLDYQVTKYPQAKVAVKFNLIVKTHE